MAATATRMQEDLERPVPQPDVAYFDGELKARPVVFTVQGLLQAILCSWFRDHRQEWDVKAAVEVRTRVSPTRVLLPDIVVGPRRKWPQVLVESPLIVIEVLSPSDSYTEVRRMAQEYRAMGVQNIWLIDSDTLPRSPFRQATGSPPHAWRSRAVRSI